MTSELSFHAKQNGAKRTMDCLRISQKIVLQHLCVLKMQAFIKWVHPHVLVSFKSVQSLWIHNACKNGQFVIELLKFHYACKSGHFYFELIWSFCDFFIFWVYFHFCLALIGKSEISSCFLWFNFFAPFYDFCAQVATRSSNL